jgi:hypothetical protein
VDLARRDLTHAALRGAPQREAVATMMIAIPNGILGR